MRSFRRSIHFSALLLGSDRAVCVSERLSLWICLYLAVVPAGAAARRSTPRCPASSGGLCGCIWPSVCPSLRWGGSSSLVWNITLDWVPGSDAMPATTSRRWGEDQETAASLSLSVCLSVSQIQTQAPSVAVLLLFAPQCVSLYCSVFLTHDRGVSVRQPPLAPVFCLSSTNTDSLSLSLPPSICLSLPPSICLSLPLSLSLSRSLTVCRLHVCVKEEHSST